MTTIRRPNGSIIGASVIPIGTGGGNIPGIWCRNEHYSLLTSGVFPTPSYQVTLLIAGGGGGGNGGAGGAGGLVIRTNVNIYRQPHNIIIGAGGVPTTNGTETTIEGPSLSLIKGLGGGSGGAGTSGVYGAPGGSGGGGQMWNAGGQATPGGLAQQPGSIWGGYGNNGATGASYSRHGSGGGAGGAPRVNTSTGLNLGGIGITSSITGTATEYCAGGGVQVSIQGTANSGNGGGGNWSGQGNAGSGVVIISYKSPGQQGSGGVTTWYVDGNGDKWWVHKFVSSGTYSG